MSLTVIDSHLDRSLRPPSNTGYAYNYSANDCANALGHSALPQLMGPANRPLDLDWLEDFMALAACGNFSRAAESRLIAQPAFSRHIRALEAWVGVALIDRSAHPTRLTAAGRKFHPLVAEVLGSLQAARIKAQAAQAEAAIGLRFAVTHSLSMTFFPQWLASLEGDAPIGPIHLMSDNMRACEELMAQRRVQFLLCYAHPSVPGKAEELDLPMLVLAQDTLVPVCAPTTEGHAACLWSDKNTLGDAPLLGYSEASALGRILRHQLFARRDVNEVFTAHHAVLLKAMVLQGRGAAWLPRSLAAGELTDGKLVLAADAAWHVPIDIRLYRQRAELAASAERLWQRLSK